MGKALSNSRTWPVFQSSVWALNIYKYKLHTGLFTSHIQASKFQNLTRFQSSVWALNIYKHKLHTGMFTSHIQAFSPWYNCHGRRGVTSQLSTPHQRCDRLHSQLFPGPPTGPTKNWVDKNSNNNSGHFYRASSHQHEWAHGTSQD